MSPEASRSPTRRGVTSSGLDAAPSLARELSEFARELQAQAQADPGELQQRIVDVALSEISGSDGVTIMLVERDGVVTAAHSGRPVTEVDDLQYRAGDGPCLTSLRESATIRSDDLAAETRWPQFAPGAVRLGIRSMLAVQLFVEKQTLGALNFYSATPRAFDYLDESHALLLASHASIALGGARTESGLRTALESRDLIGQAKGILMERYKIDANAAFDLLIRASRGSHVKLRDVAEQLARTGELLGRERPPF